MSLHFNISKSAATTSTTNATTTSLPVGLPDGSTLGPDLLEKYVESKEKKEDDESETEDSAQNGEREALRSESASCISNFSGEGPGKETEADSQKGREKELDTADLDTAGDSAEEGEHRSGSLNPESVGSEKPQPEVPEPTETPQSSDSSNPQSAKQQSDFEVEKIPDLSSMSIQAYEPDTKTETLAEKEDILSIETTEPLEEFQVPEIQPSASAPIRPVVRKELTSKVDARQQHKQSHRPFDFSTFLAHLRKKSADPIVRYIRSFLVSFAKKAPMMSTSQKTKAVRHFTDFIAEKFHEYEPFALMDATDTENSLEGVEKLVMNRLYDYCFPRKEKTGALKKDLDDDDELSAQMEKYSWLSGVHLDVDVVQLSSNSDTDYLLYAETELNKINTYRAPRDKIICILNACKIIFSLLRVNGQETNADQFIPLLILVMLRAKTPLLLSNLHYIERYRGEKWLSGETSYYLSTVQGAILFIQSIRKDDLTVSPEEYDAHMEAWEDVLRQRTEKEEKKEVTTEEVGRTLSPSGVILASAEMLTKSISSFMSPDEPAAQSPQSPQNSQNPQSPQSPQISHGPSTKQIDEVFGRLCEMFPSLDTAVMRDIVVMNDAKLEQSLDMCLQLVE